MGIYDREYVRATPRSPSGVGNLRTLSVNTWLIIICIGVFVLDGFLFASGATLRIDAGTVYERSVTPEQIDAEQVLENTPRRSQTLPGADAYPIVDGHTGETIGEKRFYRERPVFGLGHFSTGKGFLELQVWRLITFQFLHANLTHLLFNMLGLFFFGSMVENYLGRKRYLAFYLVTGVFGALAYLLLNLLGRGLGLDIPGVLFNDMFTPLIGASAGVFGVLMAAAKLSPNTTILIFFILPMRLATAVYAFVAIAAFTLITGGSNAGGEAAHLGGALAGFYFIRHPHLLRDFFDVFGPSKKRPVIKSAGGRGGPKPRRTPASEAEVERLLAKISTQGLHSLTPKERKTLQRASEEKRRA